MGVPPRLKGNLFGLEYSFKHRKVDQGGSLTLNGKCQVRALRDFFFRLTAIRRSPSRSSLEGRLHMQTCECTCLVLLFAVESVCFTQPHAQHVKGAYAGA